MKNWEATRECHRKKNLGYVNMENQNKTLIEEDAPKPCTARSLWETSKEAPGSSTLKKLAQFWPFHPCGFNGRPLFVSFKT